MELLQLLAAGGDVGVWVLVFVMWRFDRRLLQLEVEMRRGKK